MPKGGNGKGGGKGKRGSAVASSGNAANQAVSQSWYLVYGGVLDSCLYNAGASAVTPGTNPGQPPSTVTLTITDPTDIASLVLWLDASDATTMWQTQGGFPVTADGQGVATWFDKSGNDNDVTQASGSAEPYYKTNIQNGLSVLRSVDEATDKFLYRTSSVLSQDQEVTVFYVAAATSDETYGVVYCNSNAGSPRISASLDSRNADRAGIVVRGSTSNTIGVNPTDVGTGFNQFTSLISGGYVSARLNGEAGSPTALTDDGVTTNDYTRIFNQPSGNYLYGDIGELVIYDSALTDVQIAAVETYLKNKWATP